MPSDRAFSLATLKQQAGKWVFLATGFVLGALVVAVSRTDRNTKPAEGAEHSHLSSEENVEQWTCSMHPQIRSDKAGQCPICGMDLVPVASESHAGTDGGEGLSQRAQALRRMRTSEVKRRSESAADLRLLGRVEENETTLKTITAWTGGRIDRLHVKVTGQRVRAGQVIATLYSPEIFAAHQDLLVAKRQVERMAQSSPTALGAAQAALTAARERLSLLGVPNDALAQMEQADKPTRSISIHTPFGGTVIERVATEGAYVTTGAVLYRIADLSSVWVQLDAYESDLASLTVGQAVQVEAEAYPGQTFEGKVSFIDPTVDPKTRTARVRVEVKNREGRLRPGMFAHAIVMAGGEAGATAPLVVPDTAPLFTGRRAIVYVEVSDGKSLDYEPRAVRLGPKAGDFYPVVAGLHEGDRVVTQGAFVLDADLQIKGGPSMMSMPDDREPGPWDAVIDVPRSELRKLAPVVTSYVAVHKALAADDLALARDAAIELNDALSKINLSRPAEAQRAWAQLADVISAHARHVAEANSIEHARMGFEGLSDDVAMLLHRFGNPLEHPLVQAHCPMAFGSRGASWIQQGQDIKNAYFGASMQTCGEVQESIAPGAHLQVESPAKAPSPAPSHAGHSH